MGTKKLQVLKSVSLDINRGELVSIIGKSGSGKSTLLNMIGMLDNYDNGEYWFDGQLINIVSEAEAARYRNQYIGFVFQTFHLIGTKSALDNVSLPLTYKGVNKNERLRQAQIMLEKVGLGDRIVILVRVGSEFDGVDHQSHIIRCFAHFLMFRKFISYIDDSKKKK